MHAEVQSVHAIKKKTLEMCAVRGIVSSLPAHNYVRNRNNARGCLMLFKKVMKAFVL